MAEPIKSKSSGTGRSRMAKNVWIGWSAQLVYLVAGFVLPRMIDHSMGRQALGAWDFSWTLIAYFGLIQAGLVSSVNRYVARYRAKQDIVNVNISVSSVACVFIGMAFCVLSFTLGAVHFLPGIIGNKLGAYTHETQWAIFWLGLSLTSQICFAVFGGILAGSFRWDIHYAVNVASRVATLIGMIFVLLMSGSLATLAFIYFFCEASVLSLRVLFAYRVYPELELHPQYFRWHRAKEMLHFGLKTYLPSVGEMLTDQTMNLFIVWFFGPAFLALYARPRALIRNVQTFITRYAYVLVPTASSIHAKNDKKAMAALLIEGSKNGAFILLPAVIFLGIYGDSLLAVWMGKDYVHPYLFLVMLFAYLPPIFHLPLVSVISGANMHGRLGIMRLISSMIGLLSVLIFFRILKLDIIWAVGAFAIPLWIGVGFYVPYYAHKYLAMPLRKYIHECIWKPALLLSPYLLTLLVTHGITTKSALGLAIGIVVSMIILPLVYWFFVFSDSFREKIRKKLLSLLKRNIMY